jgi:hypothetical protein
MAQIPDKFLPVIRLSVDAILNDPVGYDEETDELLLDLQDYLVCNFQEEDDVSEQETTGSSS